ncbi:copper chaperone PCu(A)C [uncultured Roseobacter sp.]|uniref:copper chaperone PCu(A)C n=1 Tax=uncultured Roseobacter sp. TaxID=114847 RepID=UPI002616778A|nr:copper chaperone PCu(A)C [uncultured Roseobacter sp.]
MKFLFQAATAALFTFTTVAFAHEYTVGDLVIDHPRAFETAKTAKTGGGYLLVTNNGDTADRLIEVRADFPKVMLHTTEETDGIARMMHVDAIDIPAGETVALEPGGFHVMFMGLNGDPFEVGEEVPATLVFENAGEVEVMFNIEERSSGHENKDDHSEHKTTN